MTFWLIVILVLILVFGGERVGRTFTKTVRGTVNTAGKLADKTAREAGSMVKGAVSELHGDDVPVEIEHTCSKCGTVLANNARFCSNCGTENSPY